MRDHLKLCLEMGIMCHFPSRAVRKHENELTRKSEPLEVYCHCRLPEEGNMIRCDRCQEWYHSTCTNAPNGAWANSRLEWLCNACV